MPDVVPMLFGVETEFAVTAFDRDGRVLPIDTNLASADYFLDRFDDALVTTSSSSRSGKTRTLTCQF